MNSLNFILNATTPNYIQVADKPLNLGGEIKMVSHATFEKWIKGTYREGISRDSSTPTKNVARDKVSGFVPAEQLKQQVEKVLKANYENLVICMGACGWGLCGKRYSERHRGGNCFRNVVNRNLFYRKRGGGTWVCI